MRDTLTYIHFRVSWQLLSPDGPSPRLERARFHDFLQKLSADPVVGDYDDLSYRPERCELAKSRGSHAMGGEAFSKVVWAAGQLSVVEEWADISADDFTSKFTAALRSWFQCFPQTVAVMEQCCLRALIQPRQSKDARQFIGDKVLRLGERLQRTFSNMPHQIGFMVSCQRPFSGGDMLIETHARSWRDVRSVWIEVAGTAPMRAPINATDLTTAEQPFTVCRRFLEDELIPLLKDYDAQDSPGAPE